MCWSGGGKTAEGCLIFGGIKQPLLNLNKKEKSWA